MNPLKKNSIASVKYDIILLQRKNMKKITREEAQYFLLNHQLLNNNAKSQGKEGVLEVFGKIKTVQYDPLNVVGRNPDLVLQARIKNYSSAYLEDLLYNDRTLVDGWDKMMSIYLSSDWPCFNTIRNIKKESVQHVLDYRNSTEALNYIDEVLEILKQSGPLLSTKIDLGKIPKGKWGHGKIAGATLDYLFHIGKVGISSKRGTQKVYDLIENLLPVNILECNSLNDHDEFYKWLILRRIQSIGMFWNNNSIVWDGIDKKIKNKDFRQKTIEELLEENLIEEVNIDGIDQSFFVPANFEIPDNINFTEDVKLLAPLDNILWDRKLIAQLFDFNYTWEVYTPKIKRKYGYYVLPLLYQGKFIGRIEPVFEKKDKKLIIKNIWFEDKIKIDSKFKGMSE